ncbi:hypothetical protein XSR1_130026 [Xenorhabdus szentirmaii DSM 16338]|uniref:Uncharacterized protein n=1 Tax=Xenorhabdus szentirmaii DSM 16338 TaxID=1427518 RepID=W1ISI4_9GAMM|nr:hypothetical protein XSR1_130026 [Xenorhabdus szentirmaii DSM 16338]
MIQPKILWQNVFITNITFACLNIGHCTFSPTPHEGELRMQEFANLLNVNQSLMSRLVERLARNNYTFHDPAPMINEGSMPY